MKPEISVIMSVHNDAPTLQASIDSMLTQRFADFEFIIVNDGSTDGTGGILACQNDRRIVCLKNSRCLGLPRSLNIGLAIARGRFIARMDADDISLPDRLSTQHEFLKAHPEIGICGTYIEQVFPADGRSRIIEYPTKPEEILERIHVRCPLAHMTVLARREVYVSTGGYNSLYRRAQDVELWGRVARVFKISNVPQVLVRVTERERKSNLRGLAYGSCARLQTAMRHSQPFKRMVGVFAKALLRDLPREGLCILNGIKQAGREK